jgi:hypothetical protein
MRSPALQTLRVLLVAGFGLLLGLSIVPHGAKDWLMIAIAIVGLAAVLFSSISDIWQGHG